MRSAWPLQWTTRCTVTVADPARCFAFDVLLGGSTASRRFDLLQAADSIRTEVIQSWWDGRGPTRRRLSALTSGVRDRASHNRKRRLREPDGFAESASTPAYGSGRSVR